MKIKLMLGISFFQKNSEEASKTVLDFCKALLGDANCVLGIETDGLGRNTPEMKQFINDRRKEEWPERKVYIWDEQCDKSFFLNWPTNQPVPFYQGFSYGGAVNRILTLAKLAGCQYLVRIDPGTAPLDNFNKMIMIHIKEIENKNAEVVSGQYSDRIALRDDFVPEKERTNYYSFIQGKTGVDPHHQITGGAAFTLNVMDGPPPIPFPGFTPVWASDDGIYATLCQDKALIPPNSSVFRYNPGMAARYGEEYPVRLASMAILKSLLTKHIETDALEVGYKFLEELKAKGFYKEYKLDKANEMLQERAQNIIDGWNNYKKLKDSWSDIIIEAANIAKEYCKYFINI